MEVNRRTRAIGQVGESWAFEQLAARGFKPQLYPHFGHPAADMRVGQLPVEVKFAYPTQRWGRLQSGIRLGYTRWQWNIHPTSHKMTSEWVLILLAADSDTIHPFILPGSLVGQRTQVQITSPPKVYRGWLKQWLDRWEIITYLQDGTRHNGFCVLKD